MNSNWIYLVALVFCWATMVVIDYFLKEKAEYLNAWSVVVNLLRLPCEAPTSRLMQQYGLGGELLMVLLLNGALAFSLVRLVRVGVSVGR